MWTRNQSTNKRTILLTEYKEYEKLHWISVAAAALIAIGVCLTLFFLYTNIYQAISKTRDILLTDSTLTVEIVDFQKHDSAMAAWNKRNELETPTITRDPFTAASATSTPQ
ncbi:MAG: hypothetical protein HY980_00655 [Candidatus Magasanikbacteria bacterium]|nr:hypothetical protein [Candidatus Magasanikbacteria bacterium]